MPKVGLEFFDQLRQAVGDDNLKTDAGSREAYAYDATTRRYPPEAVVFPGSTQEVARVLALCSEYGVYVTPRGAGTGMTGGSLAVRGGIVLATSRMDRVLSIDPENMTAEVEPGVITAQFQAQLEKQGLFYPPDPSSAAFSTMGGNVAECAGGPRAVKYGVTREWIMGVEAVLASGEVIVTGVQTAKGVVGYDLTRLLVGSEGTLGVITRIRVRLVPKPRAEATLSAVYDDVRDAAATVSAVFAAGIVPRSLELLDRASLVCAEGYLKLGLPVDAAAVLLIDADGEPEVMERQAGELARICAESGAREVAGVDDPERAALLWKARKALSPALYRLAPHKINEDIVVPRNRIPLMVARVDEIREDTGLTMVCFGHAGDGNLHVNVMLDKSDPNQLAKATAAVNEIFDYTMELGGSLSGEHGVGITKRPYIHKEIPPVELSLMRGIKRVFDPQGILNPGKIF